MFFSKSALLALALVGSASAASHTSSNFFDLSVEYQVGTGPWNAVSDTYDPAEPGTYPQMGKIGCGTSEIMNFKVTWKYATVPTDSQHDMNFKLVDLDGNAQNDPFNVLPEDTLEEGTTNVGPLEGGEVGVIVPMTFHCTSKEDGCKLDYNLEKDLSIDGEKSTYAFLRMELELASGATPDIETQYFMVGCEMAPIVFGDPHFVSWQGKWFDYQGECDMVFVDAPKFAEDLPMRVNIRTKGRYDYSFIEAAVLQLGEETFEVGSWGQYFLNGVEGADLSEGIAGYSVIHTTEDDKHHKFEILIGEDGERIEFKTYKDWVGVSFQSVDHSRYSGSLGMMGSHDQMGRLIGRDGVTKFDDINAFANEWQVRADEPMLFHTARMPQAPQQCILPSSASSQKRRLGMSIARESAIKACQKAGWTAETIEMCVHDVMATGELEMADAGVM